MNRKNRLSGQIMRVAALALAFTLIFGGMAVSYAEGENTGTGITTSSSDVTESTSPSDVSGTTTSHSDVNGTTTSPSDVGGTTTSPSDVGGDTTGSTNAPTLAELDVDGGIGEVRSETFLQELVESHGSFEVNVGDFIFLYASDGEYLGTVNEALAKGATVSIYNASADPLNDRMTDIPIYSVEGTPVFSVTYNCFEGGASGGVVIITFTIKVAYQGAEAEKTLEYAISMSTEESTGTSSDTDEDTDSPTSASSSDESEPTASNTEATGSNDSTNEKKESSDNTDGSNPDTSDITMDIDPARSTAAAIMLTLGLLIAAILVGERVISAAQERKRRAAAIRR